jgi:hypothetical protein
VVKEMNNTFYFYVNFPRFSERRILIHRNTCGHCNDGNGQRGTGSNEKGFWAGPFKQYDHASEALRKLNSKFQNPPMTGDCDCI